ncbi:bacillithiol biosynthesis deacetylase BshB1 [Rhodohalobacter halophilus]|uniref:bacillithiol biosynthesis deacetylase BshB1 n=1 Tax=Rhodohalobacter halophilus TaxID=1812810 RepID=UPI00083FB91B|nr:bacillithiol biosynthesis deacetylase BshB1 [Rhodohalobacter halophilus]
MKVDILAFGAHPDDTELSCSGTLASLIKQGKKVAVVDLTRGEMGSRGTPKIRMKEAAEAAKILGLSARENLGLPDTELRNKRAFHLPIIQAVRKFKPHVCLIPAPSDRHPDHGDAARLLIDAIFYGGLIKIETKDENGNLQEPHRPSHVLHFMQDRPFEPDVVFDISDTIDIKEEAIKAFSTQFDVADPGDEPETYISDPEFFQALRARAKHFGHLGGFSYGEGFLYQSKPIPLSSFNLFSETKPKR